MSTDTLHLHEDAEVSEKLRLLKSPVVVRQRTDSLPPANRDPNAAPDLTLFGDRFDADTPEFRKHEDASLLELFFDLLFAANFSVFAQNQGVNNHERFKAYVGYFSILWLTWLIVSMYDVRFVTDSVFERICRAIHLGVMMGFAVVSPDFKLEEQKVKSMRTMSIILCISRACVTVEYASILWHIRRFKKQRLPMILQISLTSIVSMIYLGLTFAFQHGDSKAYLAWFVLAAVEVLLSLALAAIFPVLSLRDTHLIKRMTTMTVLFLGDGVVNIAQNVVTIVKGPAAWDALTIGIVTAASATIYFVFLVYFDWMKASHLPTLRQQLWTIVHFPFHLAMVIFMQSFTQFILWSKIVHTLKKVNFEGLFPNEATASTTTQQIVKHLKMAADAFFKDYPPKYQSSWETYDEALANISTLPNHFWTDIYENGFTDDNSLVNQTDSDNFLEYLNNLINCMRNGLLGTFGINIVEDVSDDNKNATATELEKLVTAETVNRFEIVFIYGYIAAGIIIILTALLIVIAQTKPWHIWATIRNLIFFFLGLGLAFVSLISLNDVAEENYKESPMLLPTICIVWFLVLVLTHLRNTPLLFKRS
ncbi:hypothetical protein BGZ63DRAFT_357982 [Mariannaea sp. PMI_226]|nr:hypothetical protein BGZ63DRAFT_357982 [Mariannaea sp. PMI_226]